MIKTANRTANFESKKLDKNVVRVNIPFKNRKGWEWWCLLRADAHHDNPKCNQDLERYHLNQAVERGAGIVDAGDLFCAMQGKYDHRSSKGSVRPEHQVDNYLDALVTTAADFYQPYSKNFISIGVGNHETKILEKLETNLCERLISCLNDRTGSTISNGGYGGLVQFYFQTYGKNSRGNGKLFSLYYYHGHGGGGNRTKGTGKWVDNALMYPDADIILTGHIHEQYVIRHERIRWNSQGRKYKDTQYHVQVPTYKDAYGDGTGGWWVETGKGPRPLGGMWLKFYWSDYHKRIKVKIFETD